MFEKFRKKPAAKTPKSASERSSESKPRQVSTEAFVCDLYTRYLDREPDPEGLAFWISEIDSGNTTTADAEQAFAVLSKAEK